MKHYKIIYNLLSGLQQPTKPITAYCYNYKDNFFHFYDTKENFELSKPFRSINTISIMSIDDITETKI